SKAAVTDTLTLFWLGFWGFYSRDEGHVYHSDAVATGGENDERAAVGSKVSEVSRRDFARPAVGKADGEGPEGGGLEIFFDSFFRHSRFCSRGWQVSCVHAPPACFSFRSATVFL